MGKIEIVYRTTPCCYNFLITTLLSTNYILVCNYCCFSPPLYILYYFNLYVYEYIQYNLYSIYLSSSDEQDVDSFNLTCLVYGFFGSTIDIRDKVCIFLCLQALFL